MYFVAVVVGVVAGCSRRNEKPHEPGTCLALPAAVRSTLRSDPAGNALYWFERIRSYDYDGELTGYQRLVRYDLRSRRAERMFDDARPPLVFTRDGMLVGRDAQNDWVALVADDGAIQDLTEGAFDVIDFELVDDHTIALLADGEGEPAVYVLDLDRPRPQHLIDADILLSTSGGRIYVVIDDKGLVIDAKTREQQPFAWSPGSKPNQDGIVYVEGQSVAVRSMRTGEARTVIANAALWKLVHQTGSVLARTPPANGVSQAAVLANGTVRHLPTVRGGASILSTTSVGDQVWALIGHNTANYVGDVANTPAESEVCLLPTSGEVTFQSRTAPARYQGQWERMRKALTATAPDGRLQILESNNQPITVSIELDKEVGGMDLARMRKRVQELQQRVTPYLANREVRTEVRFADGRTGVHRWRRDRMRDRISVGMGDALLPDPDTFELDVHDLNFSEDGPKRRCTGTLVNIQAKAFRDLHIRCWAARKPEVVVATLEPGARYPFELVMEDSDANAKFHVVQRGEPLEVGRLTVRERTQKVFELGAHIHAATGLALYYHDVDDAITLTVEAGSAFLKRSDAERTKAATDAFNRYGALGAIYGREKSVLETMRIYVTGADVSYDFDGEKLTRRD